MKLDRTTILELDKLVTDEENRVLFRWADKMNLDPRTLQTMYIEGKIPQNTLKEMNEELMAAESEVISCMAAKIGLDSKDLTAQYMEFILARNQEDIELEKMVLGKAVSKDMSNEVKIIRKPNTEEFKS